MLVALYYQLILRSTISIFAKKWDSNKCDWAKHTYLYPVCWGGLGRSWIGSRTHCNPNLLSLEDGSSVSGLKAPWHIFSFPVFFPRPCLGDQTAFWWPMSSVWIHFPGEIPYSIFSFIISYLYYRESFCFYVRLGIKYLI